MAWRAPPSRQIWAQAWRPWWRRQRPEEGRSRRKPPRRRPQWREGTKGQDASSQQSFEPGPTLWPDPGGGLPCRPIRAKFRPSALPGDAGAAILHLVTEKLVKLGALDESLGLSVAWPRRKLAGDGGRGASGRRRRGPDRDRLCGPQFLRHA